MQTSPFTAEDWKTIPLDPDLTITVRPEAPVFPEETEEKISRCWEKATAARPELFNGRIFCADHITPGHIEGHWTDYRHALAQMQNPAIYGDRPLRQLAVCGLLCCPEGAIIARRNPTAIYLGGFWQCPPAGTVESRAGDSTVSLSEQILAEAEEELGLTPRDLTVGRPLVAVIHPRTFIVDIGIRLDTSLPFRTVLSRQASCGNTEYDRFRLVSAEHPLTANEENALIPTTRTLLRTL